MHACMHHEVWLHVFTREGNTWQQLVRVVRGILVAYSVQFTSLSRLRVADSDCGSGRLCIYLGSLLWVDYCGLLRGSILRFQKGEEADRQGPQSPISCGFVAHCHPRPLSNQCVANHDYNGNHLDGVTF